MKQQKALHSNIEEARHVDRQAMCGLGGRPSGSTGIPEGPLLLQAARTKPVGQTPKKLFLFSFGCFWAWSLPLSLSLPPLVFSRHALGCGGSVRAHAPGDVVSNAAVQLPASSQLARVPRTRVPRRPVPSTRASTLPRATQPLRAFHHNQSAHRVRDR